ncbi:MAG TPA: hypothetical protein VNH40_10230 [Gaiellaceae bacterium]|nr:hypothetical protein [Gaiellaceae bacterium]
MRLARRHRLLVLVSGLILLAGVTAATAGASPARSTKAANLCTVAKSVASSFVTPPSVKTLSTPQAQAELKANLATLVGKKGRLVAASPKTLKKNMRTAIGAFALLKTDLVKANWNFAALATKPAVLTALETKFEKSGPSFRRLKKYFTKTCKY